jgi:hypothetical protein
VCVGALGGVMVVLTVLTGCAGPSQYYEGTGLHDVMAAEVAGGGENVEGTRVVLREDGTALLEPPTRADLSAVARLVGLVGGDAVHEQPGKCRLAGDPVMEGCLTGGFAELPCHLFDDQIGSFW